ncbi:DNA polymerase Y family protein [Dactylosporangium sp. CA-092794]|uniref:DNA polymerase Y family protein n=1 Tax=Dactylosporangium sp. CA-092794 TaxID=3239929 RepID=UPI003D8D169E
MRTIVVWCPDWPVIAAEIVDGYPAHEAVAVMHANRVLVASPAAREEGVRRGLRKREAQGRCPQLIVLEHDPGRDMRAFEPVLAAVEALAPGVETLRPGACAVGARGVARYYGGEAVAAERIVEQIAQECGVEAQIGIAEGTFAAGLAARAGVIVPDGETPAFLAGLSIAALGRPGLVDLLRRLGIHTLGEFAALPGADVLGRFGFDAALAHRLAGGRDERPLAPRRPPPDLDVAEVFDEPIERVDAAAFAARALAERLHERLGSHGLACTRLAIEAVTETGEELVRTWRHDGLLTVNAIADRLRWQLDGWLRSRKGRESAKYPKKMEAKEGGAGEWEPRAAEEGPSWANGPAPEHGAGAARPPVGLGGDGAARPWEAPERGVGAARPPAALGGAGAARPWEASERGAGAARLWEASRGGAGEGRSPSGGGWADRRWGERPPASGIVRLRLVPEGVVEHLGLQPGLWGEAGEERDRAHRAFTRIQGLLGPDAVLTAVLDGGRADRSRIRLVAWGDERVAQGVEAPWPGRLPGPSPATVYVEPIPAEVVDDDGRPVRVGGRLELSGVPRKAKIAKEEPFVDIVGWAGPWPVDERWWAEGEASRVARFQLQLADDRAVLAVLRGGAWFVEGLYD